MPPKKPKVSEPEVENKNKTTFVPRVVPMEDMFNHINDKMDLIISQLMELKKLAEE